MNWEDIKPQLEAKLDAGKVKKPSGNFGPKGDYIEGWHAISEANRIFGFGNWSYEIKTLDQNALVEAKDSRGNPQWQAAYTCVVRLSVGDVVREDVGFGSGFAKQIGDAVEGATKEAVTDALKRALRTFGNPFGLALYDKSRENVGKPEPDKAELEQVRDRIIATIKKQAKMQDLEKFWNQQNVKEAFASLPPDMQAQASKAYTDQSADLYTSTGDTHDP